LIPDFFYEGDGKGNTGNNAKTPENIEVKGFVEVKFRDRRTLLLRGLENTLVEQDNFDNILPDLQEYRLQDVALTDASASAAPLSCCLVAILGMMIQFLV
jgi:hypothetical protein